MIGSTLIMLLSCQLMCAQFNLDTAFWNKAEREVKAEKEQRKEIENMKTDLTVFERPDKIPVEKTN